MTYFPRGKIQLLKIQKKEKKMLIADLCNYSDAYIVVKGKITVEENNVGKTKNKKLIFKSNAPFRSCISKNNNTFIVNAEDLDISMSMYNLL